MKTISRTHNDGTLIMLKSFSRDVWFFSIFNNPPYTNIWDYEDDAAWMNDMIFYKEAI